MRRLKPAVLATRLCAADLRVMTVGWLLDPLPNRRLWLMTFRGLAEDVGKGIDGAGIVVIVVGLIAATALAANRVRSNQADVYLLYRRQLGRSILLGLELLVAADIIRTVAVTPTLTSLAVLGVIVLIRTFLSFSLELEISGRWPWQKKQPNQSGD